MSLRDAVFKRDGWKCRHCGMRDGLHAHHVIYRSHQGPDELNNLITLCHICHRGHHDGKLLITITSVMESNVAVKFNKLKGWKPN